MHRSSMSLETVRQEVKDLTRHVNNMNLYKKNSQIQVLWNGH